MSKLLTLYISLVSVMILQSCGDNGRAKNFNNKILIDQDGAEFIKRASDAGLTEIKASGLAETMSKNPRVIKLAKMIIADHTQVGTELTELAKEKMVDKPDTISVKHQKKIDSLAHMTIGFDKAYLTMMVNDHVDAIGLFNNAAIIKNNTIQQFAKKTLPALKMHLDSAKVVLSSIK